MTEPLAQELATYERESGALQSSHAGKIVLIQGDTVVGTFATVHDAATDALRRFGNEPFLIRRVSGLQLKLSVALLYGTTHVGDPVHLSIG